MKNCGIFILALLTGSRLMAQPDTLQLLQMSPPPPPVSADMRLYQTARSLSDWNTAIVALHQMLAADSTNPFLQDSLTACYHRAGNTVSALSWARKVLRRRPGALFQHNYAAMILEQSGKYSEALIHYEMLATQITEPFFHYKYAEMQFHLQRIGECRATLKMMLDTPSEEQAFIGLSDAQGQQQVPVQAASWNLLGNLELSAGNPAQAKEAFQKALEIMPEFRLARNNLQQCKKGH